MPAEQRGSVYRTKHGFGVRWLEHGKRCRRAGFKSRTEARNYFRDEVRPRLGLSSTIDPKITLEEFIPLYLAAHSIDVEKSTITVLKSSLNAAKARFGETEMRNLENQTAEIAAWRATLKRGSVLGATKALRQCLQHAVVVGVMTKNPTAAIKNRGAKQAEIQPFTDDELDRLCAEHAPQGAAIVRFAAETGMRPAEWIALRWSDVKLTEGAAIVSQTYSRGVLHPYGKTSGSTRRVPLSDVAISALSTLPRGIGETLVFPTETGQMQALENWRPRVWKPALVASGIGHGNPYSLRHTFATNALATGIPLFDVARFMGTSAVQISKTYGHLVQGAEESARTKLNARANRSGV